MRNNFEFLVKNIKASEHLDYLYQNSVIDLDDYEIIENGRHETDRARKLIRTLLRKPTRDWVFVFVKSLQMLPHCDHIIHMFNNDSRLNSADYVYKL